MGDPETQPIMARLKTDWVDVLWAATEAAGSKALADLELQWDRRTALAVVLAAPGYPQSPLLGGAVTGVPKETQEVVVFHAGTQLQDGVLKTAGGRVLCVTAMADTVKVAQARAYDAVHQINFDGVQFRSDIGFRALKP
jgi:phosphoribosylamine--glycine ligase